MYEKNGKYFADWRDRAGKRLRKSFNSPRAALQFEQQQRELAHPKSKALGQRLPTYSAPDSLGSRLATASARCPKRSSRKPAVLPPWKLNAHHVAEIDEYIRTGGFAHSTRRNRSNCLRQILRWLWESHGAPHLLDEVHRYPGLRPRNVTATREEIDTILRAAPAHLRLWILLCSDLGIRSGTAGKLGPQHYDPAARKLRFVTKWSERLTLPVTAEIAALIETCDLDAPQSFVRQLQLRDWLHHKIGKPPQPAVLIATQLDRPYRKLLVSVGITRKLVPHDLRRTVAVGMLELTQDIRDVQALLGHRNLQSTLWYLDHDLRPVKRSHLELLKRPSWARKETA